MRASGSPPQIQDVLRARAATFESKNIFTFFDDGVGEEPSLTYAELDARSRAIGAALRHEGLAGKRLLLLFPPGLDYVATFFGTLDAGAIAVPAYPPDPFRLERTLPRLRAIAADAGVSAILTTRSLLDFAAATLSDAPELASARWIAVDEIPLSRASGWERPPGDGSDVAFIQYTSGSTSSPKGVLLTHANLLHNSALIHAAFGHSPALRGVVWLPPYHDMGLIGGILQTLYAGGQTLLLSPLAFLERPMRWLRAVSRFRATTSGGPNFAYDLCVRRFRPDEDRDLDLRSWSVAFTGAEPVRAETIERFSRTFEPFGFRREAFYPCYGLAEGSLIVTGGTVLDGIRTRQDGTAGSSTSVSSGRVLGDQRLEIVDPNALRPCADGTEGEIWLQGTSVAQGYWQNDAGTRDAFQARLDGFEGTWLRTGDLAIRVAGEIFVTGRRKDLIIVRGKNHHPQDIELTVEQSHPGIRPGSVAAFSVDSEDGERLIIAAETRPDATLMEVVGRIREHVVRDHSIHVDGISLLRPGEIPKTSSGKIQRHACRDAWRAGTFSVAWRWEESRPGVPAPDLPLPTDPFPEIEMLRSFVTSVTGLATETLQPGDSCLSLGLDSVDAVELQGLIAEATGVTVPLGEILRGATLRELAEYLRHEPSRPALGSRKLRTRDDRAFPLSYNQRSLWLLEALDPGNLAFNIFYATRLEAPARVDVLRAACEDVVAAHSALRSTFGDREGLPFQEVAAKAIVDFEVLAVSTGTAEEQARDLACTPFDLRLGAVRFRLVRVADRDLFLIIVHHLVADLGSLEILLRGIEAAYSARLRGEIPTLPATGSYAEFVDAQEDYLRSPRARQAEAYWLGKFSVQPPRLDLPTRSGHALDPQHRSRARAASITRKLDGELLASLDAFSKTNGQTRFAILVAAFAAFLHRYTGEHEFFVGCPASGRLGRRFQDVIGHFVDPIVLRLAAKGETCFRDIAAATRDEIVQSLEHRDYPFQQLVEKLSFQRRAGSNPVFQISFAMEKARRPRQLGAFGVPIAFGTAGVDVDLSVLAVEVGDGLSIRFQVPEGLFEDGIVETMLEHYLSVLRDALSAPDRRVSELAMLSAADLVDARTHASLSAGAGVFLEGFAELARDAGDAVAVVCESDHVTWSELDRDSASIASSLRSHGVGPGVLVGVLLQRKSRMIAALVGVIRAGGAYVPLDPAFPEARLASMVKVAQLPVLLMDGRTDALLGMTPTFRMPLPALRSIPPADSPALWGAGESLAYAIFTSGSTGEPKGVAVSRSALANFLASMRLEPGITATDVLLSVTTIAFDISTLELFLPLTSGARIVLVDRLTSSDAERLSATLIEERVTMMQATPTTWRLLLDSGSAFPRIRALCGGEQVPYDLAAALQERTIDAWNMYGPTETTVWSAATPIRARETPLIRGPVSDTSLAVLDWNFSACPVGVAGELTIGGRGLARGYLNRLALTADGFRTSATEGAGSRVYRTGDLVRRAHDGGLGFEGRIDTQVKIRGHRVELAEIESELRKHPGVAQSVVSLASDGTKRRLVAYLVSQLTLRGDEGGDVAVADLRHRAELRWQVDLPCRAGWNGHYYDVRIRALSYAGLGLENLPAISEAGQSWEFEFSIPETGQGRLLATLAWAENGQGGGRWDSGQDLGVVETWIRKHIDANGLTVSALREFLRSRLPDYMIPSSFVILDRIPTTPNGKIDRRALPSTTPIAATDEIGAATLTEETLCGIWAAVLDVARVGLDDDFFESGGHSLSAMQLVASIRETLHIALPVRTVFDARSPRALAARIDDLRHGARFAPALRGLLSAAGSAPLTFAQERLWFLDRLEPGNPAYNSAAVLRFQGGLSTRLLQDSLNEIVRRHEILRTSFPDEGGTPHQRVDATADIEISVIDLSQILPKDRGLLARVLESRHSLRAFDLARGPLLAVCVLHLSRTEHLAVLNRHHAITDGWSDGVLVRELAGTYAVFQSGTPSPFDALPLQYGDFARWQRQWMTSGEFSEMLAHWTERLANAPPALQIPLDQPRQSVRTWAAGHRHAVLPRTLADRVDSAAGRASATSFMFYLTAFNVLLHRLSGQETVLVGVPVGGRADSSLETLIGLFVNTVVLRADFDDRPTFSVALARIREHTLDALAHQELPFERLVHELKPERELNSTPIFQVFFNMLQGLPSTTLKLPGLRIDVPWSPAPNAKFDLTVYVTPDPAGLRIEFVYDAGLFRPERVEEMLAQYVSLVEQFVDDPDRRVDDYSLSETPLARRVLPSPTAPLSDAWNGAVHERVARVAARSPDAIALSSEDAEWTYRQLDEASSGLAGTLATTAKATAGATVAVFASRGPALASALLAVMKTGAAFVVLDPSYPASRLLDWLRIARPCGWLELERSGTVPAEIERFLDEGSVPRIPVAQAPPPRSGAVPVRDTHPEANDIAHLTFTSGSTGIPKCILGRHGPLTHFVPWMEETFGFSPRDRFSTFAGLSHDLLLRELFTPLQCGATLCFPPADVAFGTGLGTWLAEKGITVAHMTPAMVQVLSDTGSVMPSNHLRAIFFIGEQLRRSDALAARRFAPSVRLVNLYGASETQRAVSFYELPGETLDVPFSSRVEIPVGKGINDLQLLVVNDARRLAGIGEPGEIWFRTPHMAEGYLDNPDETARRFIANPWQDDARDRVFRTGDIGRFLPNGNVECIGRADSQVKIRGFRVELGEIEAVIRELAGIADACVVAREDLPDQKIVVAYVVGAGSSRHSELRAALRLRLPEYMIPAAMVSLPRIPLTPNGKVDRRALPRPENSSSDATSTGPADPIEERIAAIWCEVLGRSHVGRDDNFFDVGGHSLLLVKVQARLATAFRKEIALMDLFRAPTVSSLGALLQGSETRTGDGAEQEQAAARQREALLRFKGMAGKGRP